MRNGLMSNICSELKESFKREKAEWLFLFVGSIAALIYFAWILLTPVHRVEASSQNVLVGPNVVTLASASISLADSYAFFDFGSGNSTTITPFIGEMIEICNTSNKLWCIRGIVGAAGTEETYSELVSNGNMETGDPPTGWLTTNATTDGVADERTGGAGAQSIKVIRTGSGAVSYRSVTTVSGSLYVLSGWMKGDGTNQATIFINSYVATGDAKMSLWSPIPALTDWTEYSSRSTITNAATDNIYLNTASTASAYTLFDDVSFKKVITPSATGFWIRSTANGTNGDAWSSKHASFNPNQASGFTWRIISSNPISRETSSGTVDSADVHLVTDDGNASITITGLNLSHYADETGITAMAPFAWYRAEDLDATLGDGDNVTTWTDRMSAYDATQAVAGKIPTLQTAEYGGKAVVRFDGGDNLDTSSFASALTVAQVFIVVKNSVAGDVFISGVDANRFQVYSTASYVSSYAGVTLEGPTNELAAFNLYSVKFNGSSSEIWKNGRLISSGTVGIGTWAALRIGNDNSYGDGLNGDIAELIIFDRTLDESENAQVTKYVSDYYATPSLLARQMPISFAGNDTGNAKTIINPHSTTNATMTTNPYMFRFYDSSGRSAKAFAGAAYNTTGLKLFLTENSTTQNMAGSDAGFDKDAVVKWKAYRTF